MYDVHFGIFQLQILGVYCVYMNISTISKIS